MFVVLKDKKQLAPIVGRLRGLEREYWQSNLREFLKGFDANSRSWIVHKRAIMPQMPYSLVWKHVPSKVYDNQKASILLSRAQKRYSSYYSELSVEVNRANRRTLKTRILPGLSIYKALLEENDDQQKALAELDALFRASFFTKRMQGIRALNLLPDPFPIVKPLLKLMTREAYLPGSQEIIEDSLDCFALNVYRCFILDTLEQYRAKELTALFCNTDDWLAEVLPKISWERTMTLGRGGDCCDFRWCRIKVSPEMKRR